MILVFDLDDTLYVEETFVWSGYRAVARHLEQSFGVSAGTLLGVLQAHYEQHGRHGAFEAVLTACNRYTPTRKQECIRVYRTHAPEITLSPAGASCLQRFRRLPLYVVTDGNKTVQSGKIKALHLETHVKRCFVTYRHGLQHAKPSPYCFLKIAKMEKALPQEIVYIADNPNKDFVGIKPLGFRTIRVHQGPFAGVAVAPEYDAHAHVDSLDAITDDLLQQVFSASVEGLARR